MISRRRLLLSAPAVVAAGDIWSRASAGPAGVTENLRLFSLGVASGDPSPDGVVLWTRLCTGPLEPAPPGETEVTWTMALDRGFKGVVRRGRVAAVADRAHCVHAFVDGLEAGTEYFYRFEVSGIRSPMGRTKTLPACHSKPERLRIAITSCQEYSSGYFSAYGDLIRQAPDLIFHNGDYIYETAPGQVRPSPFDWTEAVSLEQYRALYALYRQDIDLQRAHASVPWLIIWDDHEVANDWGPDHFLPSPYNVHRPGDGHGERVSVARRAYLEHMPLRAASSLYDKPARPQYQQVVIGDLLELSLLDVRSYRDPPVCNGAGALSFPPCDRLSDSQRSMLGQSQEEWLQREFGTKGCVWNGLGQTTVFAPFNRGTARSPSYETDSWDNYPANRDRIMAHIRENKLTNVVSLAGNIHAFYLGEVAESSPPGDKPPILSEFVTTSISAGGGGEERYEETWANRPLNPGMVYFDNRHRGYMLIDITREKIQGKLRTVRDVASTSPRFSTLKEFVLPSGGAMELV